MPSRIVRDGILTSESVCALSWAEEVFYRRLMSVADDRGRFHAMPKLLRAACYPLQIDKVSDSDIGKWTTACVAAGLVRVYPAQDGKRYIEIVKFCQRVQSKSKFPDSAEEHGTSDKDNTNPPCSTVEHRLVGVGVGVGVVKEAIASSSSASRQLDCPHVELIDLFGKHLPMLSQPKPELWGGKKADAMRARWKWVLTAKKRSGQPYASSREEAIDFFDRFFGYVSKSDFLTGRDGKWTGCNLGWLMTEAKFSAVIEGNYDNRELEAA